MSPCKLIPSRTDLLAVENVVSESYDRRFIMGCHVHVAAALVRGALTVARGRWG
jgi:hypothetical protein